MDSDVYEHITICTCTARSLKYTNNSYSLLLPTQIYNKVFYKISAYLQQETVKPGFLV